MFVLILAGAVLAPFMASAQDKPAETGNLAVSIQYTGKGTVDREHRIWIWVFDTPSISANSTPLQTGDLAENGGTYRFVGLPKEVYLAMAYDEKGGYDGTAAPPPPGTPIAIYGAAAGGAASPVPTGGDDAVLKTSFDDSVRMP
jgi:hypothetical protein